MQEINVLCVKWGTKYSSSYVNMLYDMVKKNLTLPFQMYCYTDDAKDIYSDISIIDMIDDDLEEWWPKLRLFEKGFAGLSGRMLYLDLDTVIQSNLDKLVQYGSSDLTIVKCYWKDGYVVEYKPGMDQIRAYRGDINSSVTTWDAGACGYIWDKFFNNPEYYMNKYATDDRFLHFEFEDFNFFPPGWIYSRLNGIGPKDEKIDKPPWYFDPNAKICLMNGFHALTPEHFKWAEPYKGLEKYYAK